MVSWVEPTAEDNRGVVNQTASHRPGVVFPLITPGVQPTAVTYTARDAAGNVGVCNFTVSVLDVSPPVVHCPAAVNVSTDRGRDFFTTREALLAINVTDNDAEVRVVNLTQPTFLVGSYIVRREARDRSGLTANCSFVLNVLDTEPPTASCGENVVKPTSLALGEVEYATWNPRTATDNVGLAETVTYDVTDEANPVEVQQNFSVVLTAAETVRKLRTVFRDVSGLTSSCNFQVSFLKSTSTLSTSGSSASSVPIIAGAAAGGVVLLAVLFVVYKRRQRRAVPHDFTSILQMVEGLPASVDGTVVPREIKREHIKIVGNLGKGNFGSVDKGLLNEQRAFGVPAYLVAVKQLLSRRNEDRVTLLEEAAVMAQFQHPHCVALIGVVTAGDPLMVRGVKCMCLVFVGGMGS